MGQIRRTAVASLLTAGATLAVAAAPAMAKSDVNVTVSTRVVRVGQGVVVTGTGGDDGVVRTYVCLDRRYSGGGWQQLGCAAHNVRTLVLSSRADRRGPEQFRARLVALRYRATHLTLDRVSGAVTVLAH